MLSAPARQATTIAANAWPATGTVMHQPIQEMGITAVDLMLHAVTEPLLPAWRELVHPHSLVPRDSTVAP
ncbi:substrate-binding domain-containing protein [Xanthomonas campestris pv. zinniae]|nr:substrate-binding domain-containing protein [Xanthomonas campestris pv. zinniae]